MLRVGSLFSGAGLCDLGFHRAGFNHAFFCEADGYCRTVLARHWPGVPIFGDIREITPEGMPDVDVLVGGFPCQDVSCAGGKAGITKQTRSGLWYEYKRIIQGKRPRYAVIENVKGLLSGGMEIVLSDLSAIGYDAEWQCVSGSAFGAPHLRERIFLVAYPHGKRSDNAPYLFTESERDLVDHFQHGSVADWLGVRIDRSGKKAIRQAYPGPALCRVDDGHAHGLDGTGRAEPDRLEVPFVTKDVAERWMPMLKALGNGILPVQAEFIARCILRAEGLI